MCLLLALVYGPAAAGLPFSAAPPARPPAAGKLIALTFDDGPKPYVLLGGRLPSGRSSAGLLDLLDRYHVKATFFVMGWRLEPAADGYCRRADGGVPCRVAAEEVHRRGHEIENHTYGHGNFRQMAKRYGEAWILKDIDRASAVIQKMTGLKPEYVRPPDWDIWPELAHQIEARGYHVMSKSAALPPAWRDVDSEDYFCVGRDPRCPHPSDFDFVLGQIVRRERQGVSDHILTFHELPSTVELLSRLVPELERRGYAFVTLRQYSADVPAGWGRSGPGSHHRVDTGNRQR